MQGGRGHGKLGEKVLGFSYGILLALSICCNSAILVSGEVKLHDCVFWMCDKIGLIFIRVCFWPSRLFLWLVF